MRIIPKFQEGGDALPFVPYVPYASAVGGDDATVAARAQASKKDSDSDSDSGSKVGLKDILGLISKFDGLPQELEAATSMVRSLWRKAAGIDGKVSPEKVLEVFTMALDRFGKNKFNLNEYNNAMTQASAKGGGLNDAAIDLFGNVYVKDAKTQQLSNISIKDYLNNKENYMLLTNANLLYYRAHDKSLIDNNTIFGIVRNGIGLEAVTDIIQDALTKIESTSYSGYSTKATTDILTGILLLRDAAKKGVLDEEKLYKLEFSDNGDQIDAALTYLWQSMPLNARSWLELKSNDAEDPIRGAKNLLAEFAFSYRKPSKSFAPDENPAEKSKREGSGKEQESNPFLMMLKGQGGQKRRLNIIPDTEDGKGGNRTENGSGMSVEGDWYPNITTKSSVISEDTSIDKMLNKEEWNVGAGLNVDTNNIYLGNQKVNPENLKDIMYDHTGGAMIVTLPIVLDMNGGKHVNLDIIDEYREVQDKLNEWIEEYKSKNGSKPSQELQDKKKAELLESKGIGSKYSLVIDGRINYANFGQFLVVNAITTDKIPIDENNHFIHKVEKPSEHELEKRMKEALGEDYNVDEKNHWFEIFYDDFYKACLFIPISQNPNGTYIASGQTISKSAAQSNAEAYLNFLKYQNFNSTSSSDLDKEQ